MSDRNSNRSYNEILKQRHPFESLHCIENYAEVHRPEMIINQFISYKKAGFFFKKENRVEIFLLNVNYRHFG